MLDLQVPIKPNIIKDDSGNIVSELIPFIPTKFKLTQNCKPPSCLAYKLFMMESRGAKSTTSAVKAQEGDMSRDKYEQGDMISNDQFVVHTSGRLLSGYAWEANEKC